MTYFDVYLVALSMIGEAENTSATADYQKRAERLFAHINTSLYPLHLNIGGAAVEANRFFIETLDTQFLLKEALMLPAALELASLLIIDKLPSVSVLLKTRAEDEKKNVAAAGSTTEPIKEVYGI